MSSPQLPNPYGLSVSLDDAQRVAAASLARAVESGWNVAVAVVDPSGDLVCFARRDDTQRGSVRLAIDKARCAVRFKRPTKFFEDAVLGGKSFFLAARGVVPLEGGVPLVAGGRIVGAVGVSGAVTSQDGECAAAGAAVL